uniref:non-specific serine/threonine protein kinase n=1 Tax=Plectus sambesii TaxID=2011161 RepID=A0A914VSJ1_9BILA
MVINVLLQLRYKCTSDGCHQAQGSDATETLVIRRTTQTVRAVDSLTGNERWNLSVGEHKVSLAAVGGTCGSEQATAQTRVSFKIHPSDGVVIAYDSCGAVVWEKELDSPIAQAWQLVDGQLSEMSLFESENVETLAELDFIDAEMKKDVGARADIESLIFIGTYQNNPYIIASPEDRRKLQLYAQSKQVDFHSGQSNTVKSLVPVDNGQMKLQDGAVSDLLLRTNRNYLSKANEADCSGGCPTCTTDEANALFISNVQSKNGDDSNELRDQGWYLYKHKTPDSLRKLHMWTCWSSENHQEQRGDPNRFVSHLRRSFRAEEPVSGWWRATALTLLFVLSAITAGWLVRRHRRRQFRLRFPDSISSSRISESISDDQSSNGTILRELSAPPRMMNTTASQASFPDTPTTEEPYVSKFLTEFEPVKCLGRGGFGVVFESRLRLDDCTYAVKRIAVSNSETAKEKVRREVKALAKLDHPGIVRYYHTWMETPPIGWQEATDDHILRACGGAPNDSVDALSSAQAPSLEFNTKSGVANSGVRCKSKRKKTISWTPADVWEPSSSWVEDIVTEYSVNGCKEDEDSSSGPSGRTSPAVSRGHNNKKDDDTSMEIVFEATSNNNSKAVHEIAVGPDVSITNGFEPSLQINGTQTAGFIYLYIQMQLCHEQTLREWLMENTTRESRAAPQMLDWLAQLVSAVDYVHECGLIHRDLKPSNIFFAPNGRLKIGDFGLATDFATEFESESADAHTAVSKRHTGNVGTRLYMSPEQLSGQSYTYKVDVFSLGLIFMEMLNPFGTQMERVQTLNDVRAKKFPLDFERDAPQECDFVKWLANPDSEKRPGCPEILNSDLLKEYAHYVFSVMPSRRDRTRTTSSGSSPLREKRDSASVS